MLNVIETQQVDIFYLQYYTVDKVTNILKEVIFKQHIITELFCCYRIVNYFLKWIFRMLLDSETKEGNQKIIIFQTILEFTLKILKMH